VEKIKKTVSAYECSVFGDIYGNPTASQVTAGAHAFKTAQADSIIAVGGGAALDVAKVIAVMVNHPGNVFDYEDRQDAAPIDRPLPFMITVPTTSGTGSEVGRSSVISDDTTKRKRIIFSPRMMPQLAVLDPELTVDLPAGLTASTGVDALSHLVEAYWAKGFSPLCDGIALEGIKLVSGSLKTCCEYALKGDKNSAAHLEARGVMAIAATMGATAFQKGLGTLHSCAHALSAICDLHHGTAISIMFATVAEFNMTAAPERFSAMAQAAGLAEASPTAFVSWIKNFTNELGLPSKLSELGVTGQQIAALVEEAAQDGCHASNPRATTKQDFEDLFKQAL
jgi:alcohol dehydrogenase class IV